MTRRNGFTTLLLTGFAACSLGTEPSSSPSLNPLSQAMIESIDMEVHAVTMLVDVPDSSTQLFRVQYARPAGCDRCGYPTAYGLVYGPHAGWVMNLNDETTDVFDLLPTHQYLASEEFFALVRAADRVLYEQHFKVLFAADADAPVETLRRIVAGLPEWISPWVAGALLDNPKVRADRAMLEAISSLPVYQGDAYREVRERAQMLLSAL
jgi:hypothetical protein